MRQALTVLVLVLAACSGSFGQRARSAGTVVVGAVAAGGMALDWCTTRDAAEEWGILEERGAAAMFIGSRPDTGAVDAYFAITTMVVVLAAAATPERYRWIPLTAVAAAEVTAVRTNLSHLRCGALGPR